MCSSAFVVDFWFPNFLSKTRFYYGVEAGDTYDVFNVSVRVAKGNQPYDQTYLSYTHSRYTHILYQFKPDIWITFSNEIGVSEISHSIKEDADDGHVDDIREEG